MGCWLVAVSGIEGGGFRVACWLVAICGVGGFRVGCWLVVVSGIDGGGKRFRIGCWLVAVCGVKGGRFRVACCLVVLCGVKGEGGGLSAALVDVEARKDSLSHHGLSSRSRYAGVLQLLHVRSGQGAADDGGIGAVIFHTDS